VRPTKRQRQRTGFPEPRYESGQRCLALSVVGAKSKELSPIWSERHEMLLALLPRGEGLVLPDATHLLHVQYPRAVAEALAAFFARHPFKAP
jgi:pimeloyl-ACP methyl ester carboxylesterase